MITSIIHKTAPSERKREMFHKKAKGKAPGPCIPNYKKKKEYIKIKIQ